MNKLFFVVLFCLLTLGCQAQDQNLQIIIIRHAEKPANGDNLSCMGLNRSMLLPGLINKKFGVPVAIYVPKIGQGATTKRARAYQTMLPLAIKDGLSINSSYEVDDAQELAKLLLNSKGKVVVCWEHKELVKLVHALGVKSKSLTWPDNDYDSIWILSVVGGKLKLKADVQSLNPGSGCKV